MPKRAPVHPVDDRALRERELARERIPGHGDRLTGQRRLAERSDDGKTSLHDHDAEIAEDADLGAAHIERVTVPGRDLEHRRAGEDVAVRDEQIVGDREARADDHASAGDVPHAHGQLPSATPEGRGGGRAHLHPDGLRHVRRHRRQGRSTDRRLLGGRRGRLNPAPGEEAREPEAERGEHEPRPSPHPYVAL